MTNQKLKEKKEYKSTVFDFFTAGEGEQLPILLDFLDSSSTLNLRKTNKLLRQQIQDEVIAEKRIKEEIGPDLRKLVKADEKAKAAYLRHKGALKNDIFDSALAAIRQQAAEEQGQGITLNGWIRASLLAYPNYHPEVIIVHVLRQYQNPGFAGVLADFPHYADKIVHRILADPLAFERTFRDLTDLKNFLRRQPKYHSLIANILSDSLNFIAIVENIFELKFLYPLPLELSEQILKKVLTDERALLHLLPGWHPLLFLIRAFPNQARRVMEQVVSNPKLFARLVEDDNNLQQLIFPDLIALAQKKLAQRPWQASACGPEIIARTSERK